MTSRNKILIVLALAALVWIVFGQTAHFDWVRYDDRTYVYRSGRETSGLSFSNIAWAFTHFHAENWHPITTLSHMLDCQLFGVNPGAHHISSVVIHTRRHRVISCPRLTDQKKSGEPQKQSRTRARQPKFVLRMLVFLAKCRSV